MADVKKEMFYHAPCSPLIWIMARVLSGKKFLPSSLISVVFILAHKHTPEHPRLRLIIPLFRDVGEEEYAAVSRMVAKEIGIDLFDDTTYEPERLMYWPSTSRNGIFVYEEKDRFSP